MHFLNEVIDIVGIGASTLDRFIVVDHFPMGREVRGHLVYYRWRRAGSDCTSHGW